MNHLVTGLFNDSNHAGEAVAELKNKGYAKEVSIIAKNTDTGEVKTHSVKQDGSEGAIAGATTGAVLGGATSILAGIVAITVPGVGLVAGPLAAALTAAVTGAVAGGLIGYLVDKGIPDNKAKYYQDRIEQGDVFVAAEVPHGKELAAKALLDSFEAKEVHQVHHNE